MASKYGKQKYGRDLYSSAYGLLAGNITVQTTFSGRIGRNRAEAGAISMVFPMTAAFGDNKVFAAGMTIPISLTGRVYRMQGVRGGFSVIPGVSGILRENNGFRTLLPIVITYNAILSRPSPQVLQGRIDIRPTISGALRMRYALKSGFSIPIIISGGADVYLGEFWKPDDPIMADWVPDGPSDGPWTPI